MREHDYRQRRTAMYRSVVGDVRVVVGILAGFMLLAMQAAELYLIASRFK